MAIDFFESQDNARKRTGRLVFLFALAILGIITAIHLIAVFVVTYSNSDGRTVTEGIQWSPVWDPKLFAVVSLGTILVIGLGSLYKLNQLRGGGAMIAESLDGQLIPSNTTDAIHRRLLNVVEEMAIASGTPVPPVYVLKDERGINAFAAGYSPSDAVIGVTQGCAERLSRDQLQGVIAHEYSHILNGDMRLNLRLIGLLHGILVIGLLGYYVFRVTAHSGRMHRRSSRGKGSPLPLIAIGAGLMVVGFIGTFFGNLIKAAVSRQREFLADASAVQFTRNPNGIAGALKQIGGSSLGAAITHANASQASHMFFGRGVTSGLNAMFATHPPLPKRILRIDPSWDGVFPKIRVVAEGLVMARPMPGAMAAAAVVGQRGPTATNRPVAKAVSQVGRPTKAHVEYAAQLIESIPEPVTAAAHEPYGARAVVYALLIDRKPEPRRVQLERLSQFADTGVNEATKKLLPVVEGLKAEVRLPLVDMTMQALRTLTLEQYKTFKKNVVELAKADDKTSLFEWTLQRLLLRHLEPQFAKVKPPRVHYYALTKLQPQCEALLSTLALGGHRSEGEARLAFSRAAVQLDLPQMELLGKEKCGLKVVGEALDALAQVTPRLKRNLLLSCAECVSSDGEVTVNEAELLRAIADSLDCPMPPLLPGQPTP